MNRMRSAGVRAIRVASTISLLMIATVAVAVAQDSAATFASATATGAATGAASLRAEVFVGSDPENYLRYLQTTGRVPGYPWSTRAFSARELDRLIPRDSAHPWRRRLANDGRSIGPVRWDIIDPSAAFRYNTGSPYGNNDGAVWAGRGLTSSVQLGAWVRWGPVSLTLAPSAFIAENRFFNTVPTGLPGGRQFADDRLGGIDRPQRFGASSYSQIDPGQSTLRVDFPFLAFGASTANQGWGPGGEYPLILGNNAAGFPHVFVGSSEPLNIFIGRIHGKVMWGTLAQSDFSTVTGPAEYTSRAEPGTKRFTTGFVMAFQPRGITGLEVGVSRFFHSIWPRSGIPRSYATKAFQGFLKKSLQPDRIPDSPFQEGVDDRGVADNQLVSGFARWVLPRSGFELFGEYGRDDHSVDFRDLLQEPDHSRFYGIGMRKVVAFTPRALTAVRAEIINFQLPQLSRYRGEGEIYIHGLIRQGHTNRGQLLGADVGAGAAAGSTLAVDRFFPHGRWTASWKRDLKGEIGDYLVLGVRRPEAINVTHALGFEMSRFIGAYDLTGGLSLVREFNRYFDADAWNINALLGVRYNLR
ncbi:MAG: hypothetical protein H0T48_04875 [Gemmatimonadaceae bacterium]|nr:hypothetical protein [Gemmatimonadaceae bacterium]